MFQCFCRDARGTHILAPCRYSHSSAHWCPKRTLPGDPADLPISEFCHALRGLQRTSVKLEDVTTGHANLLQFFRTLEDVSRRVNLGDREVALDGDDVKDGNVALVLFVSACDGAMQKYFLRHRLSSPTVFPLCVSFSPLYSKRRAIPAWRPFCGFQSIVRFGFHTHPAVSAGLVISRTFGTHVRRQQAQEG